jgi:hypothetical protein
MPNKHKNRAKKRQAKVALPTPPATPTSIQTQTSFQRSDLPNNEAASLPTPPPTPDAFVTADSASFILSSQGPVPLVEDMSISVLPRPTEISPPPAYDVHGEYGGLIPVNYFRWPVGAEGDSHIDPADEILPISNGRWEIGHTVLRYRLAGSVTTGAMAMLPTMATWLYGMESSAMDIGYDLKAWTECCRKTWAAFMSKDVNSPSAFQVFMGYFNRELRKYGRVSAVGRAYEVKEADPRKYEVLDNSLPTPALIQHRSVYAVSTKIYPRIVLTDSRDA